jgi:glycosyltransferase involved in cell wall biosynthesis
MLIGVDASRATGVRRTGTEAYSARLIEALVALDRGHDYRLYFRELPHNLRFLSGRRLSEPARVELRTIRFPRLWTHVRLGLEIALHPPDALFVPSHVLPLWTHIRAAVTVHDLGYLYYPSAHPWRQRWYLDWSTRHSAHAACVIITDSQATKGDLVAKYQIAPAKIVVAPPGLDSDLAPVTDGATIASMKRRYGIKDEYFVHVGTLQPRKNLARLIQAFQKLSPGDGLQLVLAGKKGWQYQDLFRLVQRQGLEARVLFPGYVPQEDKAALLSGAVAYVFPSLYEGFGFPVLEAQACDTALICASASSLPEVAGDGAMLVDPLSVDDLANAMAKVRSNGDLRANLVARGRRNRVRFSWRTCAEIVLVALEEMVTQ